MPMVALKEMESPIELKVDVDGVEHSGQYTFDGSTVNVSYLMGGTISYDVGACRPSVVAKVLLLELIREHLSATTDPGQVPMLKTITYEEWLTLTPTEQDLTSSKWISNLEENIHIPNEAAKRLQQNSKLPIVRVRVGKFHMGEYILNPELMPEDLEKAPKWFAEVFDGFRVGYCEYNPNIKWSNDD